MYISKASDVRRFRMWMSTLQIYTFRYKVSAAGAHYETLETSCYLCRFTVNWWAYFQAREILSFRAQVAQGRIFDLMGI